MTSVLGTARAILEERMALMAPARRLRMLMADRVLSRRFGTRRISILDAGCGDGLLTLAMAKRHPGWSFDGVDRRDDLLEGARTRARARSLDNVRFEAGDLEAPLPRDGFDAVLALECLSEIPNDSRAVAAMAEALTPGGLMVVQVPDREWRPVLPGSATTWREQVRQGYSSNELEQLLGGAGLEVLSVSATYGSAVEAAQEIRDRIKDRGLWLRMLAFGPLAGIARLEAAGILRTRSNAWLGIAVRANGAQP